MENLNAEKIRYKMREKQIKTALACLSKPNSTPADREKCYFMWKEPSCFSCYHEVAQNALALIISQEQRIKELEAETKRLESLCVSKDIIIGDLSKENERLRVDVLVEPLKMVTKITSYLKSLLTKGYPIVTYEFIDRLEEKMLGGHKDPAGDKGIRIDQIAKEMLEGESEN